MPATPPDIKAIFLAAAEMATPADRAAYLDEACAGNPAVRQRVEALLKAHDQPGGDPAGTVADPSEPPGTVVAGRYKLVEEIGEGGMGTVWMAEQIEPIKRLVALKLVKPGMDSRAVLARFEAERQALAMMDHPNIARVFDGGTTENHRPYFVMEMVRGVPITTYCDDRQLTVRQRLELFAQVCAAVQHAHQKGIIHRDLKPTNVLLTEHDGKPVPKVIDFGLAKALHAGPHALTEKTLYTAFGTVVGTPLYMAPEQVALNALDVDTRADVYALGVLLYELLTGSTPLERKRLAEAAWDEIRRLIREEEPPRPSTRLSTADALPSIAARRQVEPAKLGKLIRGELDWIVMRALEKDRNRRYETANAFARDVQRYLADEPVEACPPSAWYRVRKFARKHKAPLAAAGLVMLALAAGGTAATWGWRTASKAELAMQKERDDANAARNDLKLVDDDLRRSENRTEVALARSLSLPFLEKGGYLSEPEAEVLWALARDPGQQLWLRFVDEGTRTPEAAARFAARAEPALIAALGLDLEKRERAEQLLAARLRDPALTPTHKVDVAFAVIELAAPGSPINQLGSDVLARISWDTVSETLRGKWREHALNRIARLSAPHAVRLLRQALANEDDAYTRPKLAEGLVTASGRLPAAQAAQVLAEMLAKEPNPVAVHRMAGGLAAAAGRLPRREAERLCEPAANVLAKMLVWAMGYHSRPGLITVSTLANGLSQIAGQLPPIEAAHRCQPIARRLAEALASEKDAFARKLLAEGLAEVAVRLPPDEAARLCGSAARSLASEIVKVSDHVGGLELETAEHETSARNYLADGLAALAGRLPPKDAARVCAPAAQFLAGALDREVNHEPAAYLTWGLAALTARLPPAQAAALLAAALAHGALHAQDRQLLAGHLAAAAGPTSPEERSRLCGPAARLIADGLAGAENARDRQALAEGLAALALRLPPDEAALICRRPIQYFRSFLETEQDPGKRIQYLYMLALFHPLLTAEEAHRVITLFARQMLSTRDAEYSIDDVYSSFFNSSYPECLGPLLYNTMPLHTGSRIAAIATAVGQATAGSLTALASLPAAAEPLPCRLTTQELVDLLKMPTCYGEVRKVILKHLGNRYRRQFRDHWEFVEYAQTHDLKLDFTTPPVRYRGREPAAR